MSARAPNDYKVCRFCTAIAPAGLERCASCGDDHWGPIPPTLARRVDIEGIRNGAPPAKLAGYRSEDWPPSDPLVEAEELQSLPSRDPESAAMLASLPGMLGIWGIGHIYAGKSLVGILLVLSGLSAWGVFLALTIIFHNGAIAFTFMALGTVAWVVQTMRAHNVAVERNSLRDRTWASLRKSGPRLYEAPSEKAR